MDLAKHLNRSDGVNKKIILFSTELQKFASIFLSLYLLLLKEFKKKILRNGVIYFS